MNFSFFLEEVVHFWFKKYAGLLEMGTRMCNEFRLKSLFFGEGLFCKNAKVPIFKQKKRVPILENHCTYS